MILTGCEDQSRGSLFLCPSHWLARQNQSKDRICFWKPICHLSFSKTDSAFNVTHMNGSMSNLRRARELTTRAWGCVRSSHQRGQRGRGSGSPPTGKSSFLLESRLSTSDWTASPRACWWVAKHAGLFWLDCQKEPKGNMNYIFVAW